MGAIITLTTDFGLSDAYVAAMKGVILGINPEVKLIDVCHTIKPQNILQAAFVLGTAYQYFPMKTVHLAVVDPRVGTERRAVILRTPSADFVAPDNGVLSYVIQELSGEQASDNSNLQQRKLAPKLEAVEINKSQFWRTPTSNTFHGRDIFAPVAALLSLGFPPINFGEAITSLTMLPLAGSYQRPDGSLVGNIIHSDNFGNLITNIRGSDLSQIKGPFVIEVADQVISGLSNNYDEGRGLLALVGSSGYLEVALRGGSASAFLEAEVGSEVKIRRKQEK